MTEKKRKAVRGRRNDDNWGSIDKWLKRIGAVIVIAGMLIAVVWSLEIQPRVKEMIEENAKRERELLDVKLKSLNEKADMIYETVKNMKKEEL